uniref:Uncharacterized protein n=1 Tax=viral metagenome TaxID=1070528 RepID=A0A6C0JIQ6_9ZZZZ
MDLTQNKLSKKEWETIEVPISDREKKILDMIIRGYDDVNIETNDTQSMFSFIKIEQTPETEYFLYKKYFDSHVQEIVDKYCKETPIHGFSATLSGRGLAGAELKTLKSGDSIRIQNLETNIQTNKQYIFEFLLLDLTKELMKQIIKKKQKYAFYLYTIQHLKRASIRNLNQYVMSFINTCTEYANSFTKISEIITNAYEFIEKNKYLLKYENQTLFPHQKELFTILKNNAEMTTNQNVPKLILYTAPTGTGKTLSPIGLSNQYRVIFVCVARHIGLALAKSAISMEKKVAFAFGCETASDIRLHYFSAIDFVKHRKSGGIFKVNNSVGNNVEIMICDVQSYLTAMHYMLAFNEAENIITYWDEPTITMDYEEHPLHNKIKENWAQNKIPTVVLSCATLPILSEIQPIFDDFRGKFDNAQIFTITSFDCKKSIPILNKDGFCVLPHFMYGDYGDLQRCAEYCENNKTLLRYFDLSEIVRFIEYVHSINGIDESHSIDSYFTKITDITMNGLKEYYLQLLLHIDSEKWNTMYKHFITFRQPKFKTSNFVKSNSVDQVKSSAGGQLSRTMSVSTPPTKPTANKVQGQGHSSGILLTTTDAYTLTDGPTIFLAEDVKKIGNFYIQQSNIASSVFQSILSKIDKNNDIIAKIDDLERLILAKETKSTGGDSDKESSVRESGRLCRDSENWMNQINALRKDVRLVSLEPIYVPNTKPHQQAWSPLADVVENAFVSSIGEDAAKQIMLLSIENHMKVLLLLGIGMFTETPNVHYMEIMKQLADEQRLFMIIASTDYIYGTNYQFCHGIIGKDLTKMTQQKTLQAMGRIGRNNIQQDYTIRFRDDDMIQRLFQKPHVNLEAENMCKLFCSE